MWHTNWILNSNTPNLYPLWQIEDVFIIIRQSASHLSSPVETSRSIVRLNLNGVETESCLNFARCSEEVLNNMIIKTSSMSPLALSALFIALRCYLPKVSSQTIGNDTHPNTMEGRGFWSTIPMPVISHFAGDKSRKNPTIWWRRHKCREVSNAHLSRIHICYHFSTTRVIGRLWCWYLDWNWSSKFFRQRIIYDESWTILAASSFQMTCSQCSWISTLQTHHHRVENIVLGHYYEELSFNK